MSKKKLLTAVCLAASLACATVAFAQSDSRARQEAERGAARALVLDGGGNFLGVYTESVTRETLGRYNLSGEPRGVGVTQIAEGSPAAKSGLQKGDVILRYDGEPVASPRKLQRLIAESAPGHAARLTISRGGSERELTAALGKREGARGFDLFGGTEGQLFRRDGNDGEGEKRAEEWRRYGDEWKKNGEQWKRQSEELRKGLELMPPGNFAFALNAGRRIGVTTTPLTAQLGDYFGVADRRGLLVTSVAENSPAAKAGVKAGDVITEADGEKVAAAGELSRVVNRKQEGEVTLTVVRDKSRRTLRVTPEKSSEAPTGFVLPEGFFAAPSVGELADPGTLSGVLAGPTNVLGALPALRLMRLPTVPRLNTLPRVVVPPSPTRGSAIL